MADTRTPEEKRADNLKSMIASGDKDPDTLSSSSKKLLGGSSTSSSGSSDGSGAFTGEHADTRTPEEKRADNLKEMVASGAKDPRTLSESSKKLLGAPSTSSSGSSDGSGAFTGEYGTGDSGVSDQQQVAPQYVNVAGYQYTYNPATGMLARYNEEGALVERSLYQEDTAGYVLGEAMGRGYVTENVYKDSSGALIKTYSFMPGLPADIKSAITKRLGQTGYDVSESPVDKQLTFKKHDFGLSPTGTKSTTTTSSFGEGGTFFDFTKNTITDKATGETVQLSTPISSMQSTASLGPTTSTPIKVPANATPAEAVKLAMLANVRTQEKFKDNQSTILGEVDSQFDFTKPFYGPTGLQISVPGPKATQATADTKAKLAESEWISFQDIAAPILSAAGIFHPRSGPQAEQNIRVAEMYQAKGVTPETIMYEVGQRFSWTSKLDIGQQRSIKAFGGDTAKPGDILPAVAGTTAYYGLQVPYLFLDTAFTTITLGKGYQAVGAGLEVVAKEGFVQGLQTVGKTAAVETAKIAGSPSYVITGLVKEIPAAQKAQIAEVTGGLLLASAGARATGIAPEGTPIGDLGQGYIDTSQKLGRYLTLQSKPGEREDIVASASVYNVPYYGTKMINVMPTGKISSGVELVYRGANVVASGLIMVKASQQIEQETGSPNYVRAIGRGLGEIGTFEYAFESQTIDEMFESSRMYGAAQEKLGGLVASKKIDVAKYGTYWSGIEMAEAPRVDVSGVKGLTFDIKPSTQRAYVEMPGFDFEARPSADINAKGGVSAKPDFMADIKLDVKQEYMGDARLEAKPDSNIRIHAIDTHFDMGRFDVKVDNKIDFGRADVKPDTKIDLRFDTRPDNRFDLKPIDLTPDEKIEPKFDDTTKTDDKTDIKFDQKIETKIDIWDAGILGAAFLPFLGGGEGSGGAKGIGGKTKVQGEAKDLLSTYLGDIQKPRQPTRQEVPRSTSSTSVKPAFIDTLTDMFGKKKSKRRS